MVFGTCAESKTLLSNIGIGAIKRDSNKKHSYNLERSKTQGFHRFFENTSKGCGKTSGTTTNQPSITKKHSITHVPNNLTTFSKNDCSKAEMYWTMKSIESNYSWNLLDEMLKNVDVFSS